MQLNTIIFFCLLVATIHAASLQRQPTKKLRPYDHLRSVRGTKSCSSSSCPFWEKHGRSFVSLRCYSQQFQECTCLHRMCFSSCLYSQAVCNAEMVHCIEQICPRCSSAADKHLCSAQNPLLGQMMQSFNKFSCYPCCAGAGSPLNGNTTTPPTNNGAISGAGSSVNGNSGTNGNTPRPANSANNAARPVNSGNNAARPVNGNTPRPANGNTARPANSANNAARPVNAGNNAARPVNGNTPRPANGNTARPANSANNAARPVNGGNNAARPANGNTPRPNNVNQGSNILSVVSGSNGASLNQRVQKTKKPANRQSTTVRTTTKNQNKSKTTKRTKN